jgi:hypothetical protein
VCNVGDQYECSDQCIHFSKFQFLYFSMMFSMMFSMLFMFQDKQLGLGMVRSTMTRLLALMAVLNRWKDARNTDIHLGDGVGVLLSYDGEGKQELKKKAPGLDISNSLF